MTEAKSFVIVGIALATVNTILLGLIAWHLWVARSRFDRLGFVVASFVGRFAHRVRSVADYAGWLVGQLGRVVERVTLGK
jgi:membrane protein implicated in regulation of membrane protease activity